MSDSVESLVFYVHPNSAPTSPPQERTLVVDVLAIQLACGRCTETVTIERQPDRIGRWMDPVGSWAAAHMEPHFVAVVCRVDGVLRVVPVVETG